MRYKKWNLKNRTKISQNELSVDVKPAITITKIKESRLKRFFKSTLGILTVVATISGLSGYFTFRDEIHKYFSTKHELFEEKNVTEGEIESRKISDNVANESDSNFYYDNSTYHYPIIKGIYVKDLQKMSKLTFNVGGNSLGFTPQELYKGVNIIKAVRILSCAEIDLLIVAKNDRLYVSCKFMDLKSEDAIGDMSFNHWKIFNGRYSDYRCNEESFEVLDNQGYVAFSISYTPSTDNPFVSFRGYLIHPKAVYILNRATNGNNCFEKSEPNWKRDAETEIYKIKPVLKSGCDE